MEFYNNNITIDSDNFKYYDEGSTAKVYKCGNILLKIYKVDTPFKYRIKKRVFNELTKIDSKNFVDLDTCLYSNKAIANKLLRPDAYVMKNISGKKIKLIDQNKDYLIKCLNELDNLATILSEHKIIMNDTHRGNIIFTKDGAFIIDPDQFEFSHLSKKKILIRNKINILKYVQNTLINECYSCKEDLCYNPCILAGDKIKYDTDLSTFIDNRLDSNSIKDSVTRKLNI